MKKILITGGTGYLGGRISQYLGKHKEYQVLSGTRTSFLDLPQTIYLDMEDAASVIKATQDVWAVIHLAALNAEDCQKDPQRAYKVNVAGTKILTEAAKYNGVKKLIYFSTIHVYGSPLNGELIETQSVQPTHPYALTHLQAEEVVLGERSLNPLVLRLSNAVGAPAQKEVNAWMLIANDLCRQVAQKKSITLKSSGVQLRNFIPITDVCFHLEAFLRKESTRYNLYNLGHPQNLSVIELATIVATMSEKILGQKIPIERPQPKPDEIPIPFHFSLERMTQEGATFGSLNTALEETLQFCLKNFSR